MTSSQPSRAILWQLQVISKQLCSVACWTFWYSRSWAVVETGLLSPIIFPALPDSFLDGYAPRMQQQLCLREVPFPGILKLLFVLHRLVDLRLVDISPFSLISPEPEPEATVTCPSMVDKTPN
jgi:hypothetical protein